MSKSKQITLFDENDSYWEIQKHSSFVQMGNLQTMLQRKLMNVSIRVTRDQLKRSPNQKRFSIDVGILRRLTGFKDGNNDDLKESLRALRRHEFEYNILNKFKGVEERGNLSFFSDVQIKSYGRWKTAQVTREYPERVLKEIKDPSMRVTLNLLILLLLDSKHSLTLYESLKDYARLWKIRFSISDFRKLVGLKTGQYKSFSMLTKRVIENAIEEINSKTDLNVDFEVEKIGNKPHTVQFKMKLNKRGLLLSPDTEDISKKLAVFDFSADEIKQLVHSHHSQYLLANIIVVEERLKKGESIENPKNYLKAAFTKDFRKKKTEYEKIQEQKEQAKLLQLEEEEQKDLEMNLLKWTFEEESRAELSKIKQWLSENELEELQEAFKQKMQSNSALAIAFAKWFEHHAIKGMWNGFLTKKFLAKKYHSFENYKQEIVQADHTSVWI